MRALLVTLLVAMLAACASVERDGAPAETPVDIDNIPDAVPRDEPPSRYGNPDEYVVWGKRYQVMDSAQGFRERGDASWYGTKFHGRRTSSGEPYDMYKMTAAHKSLPLPTYVKVTNLRNNRSIVVRVIDLSYVAALKLGIVATGTAPVEIVALQPGTPAGDVTVSQAPEHEELTAEALPPEHGLAMTASGAQDLASEFFIQLGAFTERGNAEALSTELGAKGFVPVGIHPEPRGDTVLHRVRLGPLATRAAAEEITLRLIGHGIEHFRIVEESR
ncbi:MAG: septal ring lytic transglycosylase RlpA family protein [Gammaproteobacteria bacterium]|nr:septal ring lytic transglycosylase RlpA family protein [Gammaproteobacteria bacterium]